MPSVIGKKLVDDIIKGNGRYQGDAQVIRIVEYKDHYGGTNYGLIYIGQNPEKYHTSEWCLEPKTIWEYDSFLHGSY